MIKGLPAAFSRVSVLVVSLGMGGMGGCDGVGAGAKAPGDQGSGDPCVVVHDWQDCGPKSQGCEPCLALSRCRAHEHDNGGEAACAQAGCVVTTKLTATDDEIPYTCTPS